MTRAEINALRDEYRRLNPRCEVTPYLPAGFRAQIERYCGMGKEDRWMWNFIDLHHIAGRGEYGEQVGNYIMLGRPAHIWATDHSRPGFVLSAWRKTHKGEADWNCWTQCKTQYRPSALGTRFFVEQCEPWPLIDRYRKELLEEL